MAKPLEEFLFFVEYRSRATGPKGPTKTVQRSVKARNEHDARRIILEEFLGRGRQVVKLKSAGAA